MESSPSSLYYFVAPLTLYIRTNIYWTLATIALAGFSTPTRWPEREQARVKCLRSMSCPVLLGAIHRSRAYANATWHHVAQRENETQ